MTEQSNSPGRWRRLIVRGLLATLVLLLVVSLGGFFWVRGRLRASLPVLEGSLTLPGLSAAVEVRRDGNGVPELHGSDRRDLARATGFLHGQDRFFQMDLLRRRSAGELAELFGPAALPSDRSMRVHRFRALAQQRSQTIPPQARGMIEAYRDGVNAGLAALRAHPPEYVALDLSPAPWKVEDSLLVLFSMYENLQGDQWARESSLDLLHERLSPALARFLDPRGTAWDAAIDGSALEIPALPGPADVDLQERPAAAALARPERDDTAALGSNSWAVAAPHVRGGGALLANDMHLGLGLPNIWYRISLHGPAAELDGLPLQVTGVTLPGWPWIIVGSNTHVAWGFTNSYGDYADLVLVEIDEQHDDHYRTASGPKPFEVHVEQISVHGAEPEQLELRWTEWGPLIDHDHRGRPRALRWTAHDGGTIRVGFDELELARTIEQAMDAANVARMPTQNFVVAERSGRIGWTLMGPVPRRIGLSGQRPVSWADGQARWIEALPVEDYPRLVDPSGGRLWTANNRIVGGPGFAKIGDGGYALGARAAQIRDGLLALDQATERDLLAIQLDDRSLFLTRWRELLLDTLESNIGPDADPDAGPNAGRRGELRDVVREDWSGRASIDSAGYRMVRAFRLFLARQVFEALTLPCSEADERFGYLSSARQWEGPLWTLVTQRPAHLLAPRFEDWEEQLLAAIDGVLERFPAEDGPLAKRSWGERNTIRIQHPVSQAVPALSRWLDLPAEALDGDSYLPRVMSPGFASSQRMVVSPGREDQGLFHMPGGQSGHPLSPFYTAGHRDWAGGRPSSFLPGPTRYTLQLTP